MTIKNTVLRRLVAGAGALALAMAGTIALSTTASAAVGPDQPGAPTTGTLTVNKYSGAPRPNPDPSTTLDGVEFTVTRVGRLVGGTCTAIDLTQAAQWDGLEGLFASAPAAPANPFCALTGAANVHVGKTVDGQVVFPLPVGIYFVQETDPGNNAIVSKVPDFYVSIPTSTGAGADGWNYNVVADPKNQVMEAPSKTIDPNQTEFVVGDDVTWTLNVPIPTLNNNETFNTAVITDTLDSRLTYVANSSVITAGTTPLTQGTHYTVTGNAVWEFSTAGRAILDANMGQPLTIQFKTTVGSVGTGAIPNDTYKSSFNGTEVPGTAVPYTYWGQLAILKTDNSSPALNLQGAQFKVFNPDANGACATEAPTTGEIATGTSDANGVVQWAGVTPTNRLGLWIDNVSNGPADPVPARDYCVYETVVPAGHVAQAIDNPVRITPGEANVNSFTVVNLKKDGPDLPLTGAQGTLAMVIGGLLIVGGGVTAIIVSRRRSSAS